MLCSRIAPVFALACALGAPAPTAMAQGTASAEATASESWTGAATLPGGAELGFSIHITRGEAPSATIDIPTQGAMGIPLEVISVEGDSVLLRIPAPANAEIAGTINDQGELAGLLKQAGMEFPFKMSRSSAEARPSRPQHPEPPFPYIVEEVSFENASADVTCSLTSFPVTNSSTSTSRSKRRCFQLTVFARHRSHRSTASRCDAPTPRASERCLKSSLPA